MSPRPPLPFLPSPEWENTEELYGKGCGYKDEKLRALMQLFDHSDYI